MTFDRATFYATLRRGTLFDHGLTQRQVTGTEAKLDMWDRLGFTDLRWLAYGLATSYHETAHAMYPVRGGGLGKGHPYGVPSRYAGQVAYGRGDVQLTWATDDKYGYPRADAELAKHGVIKAGALLEDFDLALDPQISAAIMWLGMTEAWFTSFKLSDYLNDHLADYLHARRIVNGMDQAEAIAGYALVFFGAITAGAHKAADTTSVAVRPPAPAPAPAPVAAPPATADDNPLSDLANLSSIVADTIGSAGSLIAPAGPSPGTSAPQPAAEESILMNPMTAIAIVEQVITYAPTIEKYAAKAPDIAAKGKDMIQAFQKMDLTRAVTDIEGIAADFGFSSQNDVAAIMSHATTTKPPAPAPAAA